VSKPLTFVETSRALPMVSVAVSFRSGSVHDPAGKEGLSRITARMLRRGCAGYTKERIEETDRLPRRRVRRRHPDERHHRLVRGHPPLHRSVRGPRRDDARRPPFPDDELARLLRESKAELIESRDSDRLLASRAFRRTLFAGHPYGRRAAGTLDTLEHITAADVRAFYARHYTRRNAVVAISPATSPRARATALAERLLAGLPEGEPVPDPAPPPAASRRPPPRVRRQARSHPDARWSPAASAPTGATPITCPSSWRTPCSAAPSPRA
jgi:zinc protease